MSTDTPSAIVIDLVERFRAREAVGLAKYGVTLDRNDLSPADLRQHLLEELMDACMYLVAEQHAARRQVVAFRIVGRHTPYPWVDASQLEGTELIAGEGERVEYAYGEPVSPQPVEPSKAFDRAIETPRRNQAVEKLLSLGWTYHHEHGWVEPAEQPSGEVPACERCGECRRGNFTACKNRQFFDAQPKPEQAVGDGVVEPKWPGPWNGHRFPVSAITEVFGKAAFEASSVLRLGAPNYFEIGMALLRELGNAGFGIHRDTPRPAPVEVGDGVDQAEFKRGYDHAVQHMADIWIDPAVRELRVVAVDMRHYLTRIGETMNTAMREKWGDTIKQADKRVSSALAGLREAIATPRPAVATPAEVADEASVLRAELQHMVRAYVRLLEVGRDRIVDLGGSCDPLDVMEQADPHLIQAKRALALTAQCQDRKDTQGLGDSGRLTPDLFNRFTLAMRTLVRERKVYGEDLETIHEVVCVLEAAIASPSAGAVVPEGWKLVPIEPTQDMFKACDTVIQGYGAKLVWQRMYDAAPEVKS